ncbi:hypothetical protein EPO17_02250 [Patescibacteria group bacterium]|nr:MAG: hypothetical protein EPO17_02250 [Patescibacteria group bacterium]
MFETAIWTSVGEAIIKSHVPVFAFLFECLQSFFSPEQIFLQMTPSMLDCVNESLDLLFQ